MRDTPLIKAEGEESLEVKYISSHHHLRSKIPVSNSVTAMELWLLACVILVFFSLLEYSIILWEGVKKRKASNLRLQVGWPDRMEEKISLFQ